MCTCEERQIGGEASMNAVDIGTRSRDGVRRVFTGPVSGGRGGVKVIIAIIINIISRSSDSSIGEFTEFTGERSWRTDRYSPLKSEDEKYRHTRHLRRETNVS